MVEKMTFPGKWPTYVQTLINKKSSICIYQIDIETKLLPFVYMRLL